MTRPGFRRLVAAGLALALSVPAMAGAKAAPRGVLADSVIAIGGSLLHRADIGILAVSLDKGDTLVAYSEGRRLIPGSNAKLFTNGAFLVQFGTDYRRATSIDARGKASLKDSGRRVRLDGDLILRGSGMPDVTQILSPGSRGLLDSLAYLLHDGGLERFEGTVWVDGSLFAAEPYAPGWAMEDYVYAYGAPVNAILANGNAATVVATSTGKGDEVTLELDPPEAPLRVRGKVDVVASGSGRLDVSRAFGSRVVEVWGTVPRGGVTKKQVAIPDPDSTAGLYLLGALRRAGIEVKASVRVLPSPGSPEWARLAPLARKDLSMSTAFTPDAGRWKGVSKDAATPVVSLLSPPAAQMVSAVNELSLNGETEALLRNLVDGTGKERVPALSRLYEIVGRSGVDTLDLSLVDGSGLSPMDLVTPRAVVTWLTWLDREPKVGPAFRDGLAGPGLLGTLKNRFGGAEGGVHIRGKTGTLTNVSALSGYVTTESGERIVFSSIANGNRGTVAPARDFEDRFVRLLSRYKREMVPARRPGSIPR
ncbi:MAG TPA: D-alanyl-D-alanine carboxypeptidase [Candidatus Eisenbacteria bacterium]|nr:D-alanyl-D-alanine carboxypeptidase [Candidatus Eisenbacteria bacterium]